MAHQGMCGRETEREEKEKDDTLTESSDREEANKLSDNGLQREPWSKRYIHK